MSVSRKVIWLQVVFLLLGVSGLSRFIPHRWRRAGIREIKLTPIETADMDAFRARQEENAALLNAAIKHWYVKLPLLIAIYVLRPVFDRAGYIDAKKRRNIAPR